MRSLNYRCVSRIRVVFRCKLNCYVINIFKKYDSRVCVKNCSGRLLLPRFIITIILSSFRDQKWIVNDTTVFTIYYHRYTTVYCGKKKIMSAFLKRIIAKPIEIICVRIRILNTFECTSCILFGHDKSKQFKAKINENNPFLFCKNTIFYTLLAYISFMSFLK